MYARSLRMQLLNNLIIHDFFTFGFMFLNLETDLLAEIHNNVFFLVNKIKK